MRINIALDLDNVVAGFIEGAIDRFGEPVQMSDGSLSKMFPSVLHEDMDRFVADPFTYARLNPVPGVRDFMVELVRQGLAVTFVSARGRITEHTTLHWLKTYGLWFPTHCSLILLDGRDEKDLYLAGQAYDAIVDDSISHLLAARSTPNRYLFDRPWNQTEALIGSPFTRVISFVHLLRALNRDLS